MKVFIILTLVRSRETIKAMELIAEKGRHSRLNQIW